MLFFKSDMRSTTSALFGSRAPFSGLGDLFSLAGLDLLLDA